MDGTSKHKLINTHELDKEKPIEDRVFISRKNKELLILAREERKFKTTYRKDDKKVDLFTIPEYKRVVVKTGNEQATEAQIAKLKSCGYDVENMTFSKQMCIDAIAKLPATEAQIWRLKKLNYDCSGVVTFGVASQVINDWKYKLEKQK